MRYLVAFLAVLAFALMAPNVQAQACPGPHSLIVDYDSDLSTTPTCGSALSINPLRCPNAGWRFDFCRTTKDDEDQTKVNGYISGTDVDYTLDSNVITAQAEPYCDYRSGTESVTGSSVQICMKLVSGYEDGDHFYDLELEGTY